MKMRYKKQNVLKAGNANGFHYQEKLNCMKWKRDTKWSKAGNVTCGFKARIESY